MRDLADIYGLALSSRETVQSSYSIAEMALRNGVRGDFVECGVFAGAQCAAMARAIMDCGAKGRRVHLFDTFTGIPAGGEHDVNWTHPAGTSACPKWQVEQYMEYWRIPPDMLVYHEGLFRDTIPASGIGEIAVLRLDGDLYESTMDTLHGLYSRVSKGGWVIVDDFSLPGCRKAVIDYLGGQFTPVCWQVQ